MNKIVSLQKKVNNKIRGWWKRYQTHLENQRKERERIELLEEQRKTDILEGKIQPIKIEGKLNLASDELAYASYFVNRMATVEYTEEYTEGRSKKTGGIKRAIVGGVLLGPAGAIVGAVTAGSKHQSLTRQRTIEKTEEVDFGHMIFTNKRVIFIGQSNVVSLPYNEIITAEFGSSGHTLTLKYPDMLRDEYYDLKDREAKDAKLYFEGITKHLLLK